MLALVHVGWQPARFGCGAAPRSDFAWSINRAHDPCDRDDAFAASAVRELGLSRCQKLLLQAREEAVWHVANAAQANGCDLARARAAKLLAQ